MSWLSTIFWLTYFSSTCFSGKPKVIYSNDQGYAPIGTCDGDNPQCMVHLLYYVNDIDLLSIIASGSTNCAPPGTNIQEAWNILALYNDDYDKLNSGSVNNGGNEYPTYSDLKSITVQGCNSSSPEQGYPDEPNDGSNAIIDIVNSLDDDEFVWYAAGAGLCELARALYDKPSIVDKIKLYGIGDSNTDHDPYSYTYIFNNFPNLWWIDSNVTFSGWWIGGNQTGLYNDDNYTSEIIQPSGNMGAYYATIIPASSDETPHFKEGDAPSLFYVIDPENNDRNMSDPTLPNWGGTYIPYHTDSHSAFWTDVSQDDHNEARESINQWRVDYLNDWTVRLKWLYDNN